jgi:hypothetical protein
MSPLFLILLPSLHAFHLFSSTLIWAFTLRDGESWDKCHQFSPTAFGLWCKQDNSFSLLDFSQAGVVIILEIYSGGMRCHLVDVTTKETQTCNNTRISFYLDVIKIMVNHSSKLGFKLSVVSTETSHCNLMILWCCNTTSWLQQMVGNRKVAGFVEVTVIFNLVCHLYM